MEVVMPQLGETVAEGTVVGWRKQIGEPVQAGEILFEVETEKVTTEIPALASGVLSAILVAAGVPVKVGTPLAIIAEGTGAAARSAATEAAAAPGPRSAAVAMEAGATPARAPAGGAAAKRDARGLALTPAVRQLLASHGLAPEDVRGTGREGRITRDDVLAHVEAAQSHAVARPSADPATARPLRTEIPFSATRKRTAEHMRRSLATSPHVLQAVEVDFHRIELARSAQGADWRAREGFSLTYLPFIAEAVCAALTEFPRINASIEGDVLVVHGEVNLGIAVDLNFEGLIVPVIRRAGQKMLPALAREIRDLAERARTQRLRPDDMTGGTYTLSNAGTFGTLITAPIIHQPQVAILSCDGVTKRPLVVAGASGDEIAIRPVGILAQSFDHRAFDGAYSAAFLRKVKERLEQRDWIAALRA
jgi:2-oxoglutarate dehydrogenase E2 component (dihydrolipoamide succinyltransferase)